MRHRVAVTIVFSLVAPSVVLASPASASGGEASEALLYTEGFEHGLTWNVTSSAASVTCASGSPGCSLSMDSACCGYLKVRKDLDMAVPSRISVGYSFRGSATTGNEDSNFVVYFTDTTGLTVTVTDGPSSSNNAITLYSSSAGSTTLSARWAPGAWYRVLFVIDFGANTGSIEVRDVAGALVGTSPSLALPPGTTPQIRALAVEDLEVGSASATFRYDTVEIRDLRPAPVSGIFADDFDAGLNAWRVKGTSASLDCMAPLATCALRVQPAGSQPLSMQRNVDRPIGTWTRVSFGFQTLTEPLGTDSSVVVYVTPTAGITIAMTQDTARGNDGIRMYSSGQGSVDLGIRLWRGEPYTVDATIETLAGTVTAVVYDRDGIPIGGGALRLPPATSRIHSVSIESLGEGGAMYYDAISVSTSGGPI